MSENWGPEACCEPAADLLRADLTAPALALSAAGFAALWRGQAMRPDELLPSEKDNMAETTEALVGRGRAEVDSAGRLIGIHGLTLRQTRHRFVHDEREHNTWCAFDSIGIPAALHVDAVAHTDCPACGRPLDVEIQRGHPLADEVVLWLPAPQGGHLMTEFCSTADLYCSTEHLRQSVDVENAAGTVADLATAASLGRHTWADVRTAETM